MSYVIFLWVNKPVKYLTCQKYWYGGCKKSYSGNHYCDKKPRHKGDHECECGIRSGINGAA